ncbi:MAG: type I polyketide synthase, partial [Myxococcota bacterium]
CRAFSAGANGVGWSEGAGMLVLERLSNARREGHPVLAVVRGSAINQDGRSQGLTAPNGLSQQRVIRDALASAGISADEVDVVEAHGTGTTLGDPIEAQALLATYGKSHAGSEPLWLGTVKSNFGHTQAAAGVAGVIKMVLALGNEELPKTLHADAPSPHVDWSPGTVRLLTEARQWTRNGHPRRAGVSSFGISGTNAHVIIEEAPAPSSADNELATQAPEATPAQAPEQRPEATDADAAAPIALPLVLSGRSEAALRGQADNLAGMLERNPDLALADVAISLVTTRSHFENRAVVLAGEAGPALRALAQSTSTSEAVVDHTRGGKLAVLFTGQGSQRLGMGQPLRDAFPAFHAALDAVCAELDPHLDRPILEVMAGEAELLDQTGYTQPALFALEVALFRLFESWGVRPDLLMGHSIGELAAAHVAGVLSLSDACALVCARARLMQALPAGGAMISLQASEEEVAPLLEGRAGLAIAALNGPLSTVVSGDEADAVEVAEAIAALGRKTKRLQVSHAFHSPRMAGMLDEFRQVSSALTYHPPKIPIVSNLTGTLATAEQVCSPDYWVSHVREGVRFLDGMRVLDQAGVSEFFELGPHGVLSAMGQGCIADERSEEVAFVPALRKDRPEPETVLAALARLFARGQAVDWPAYFAPLAARRVELPTYAFQREPYWLDAPKPGGADVGSAGLAAADHPLLGAEIALADSDGRLLTGRLSLTETPWLADHTIFDTVLLPGTAFVELALAAAYRVDMDRVEELTMEAPLVLARDSAAVLQVAVSGLDDSGRRSVTFHSRPEGAAADAPWLLHAEGTLTADSAADTP